MSSSLITGLATRFTTPDFQFNRFTYGFLCLVIILPVLFSTPANGQALQKEAKIAPNAKKWIFNGDSNIIQGLGIADYSRFNPEKSWDKAFENALQDLNANHSLLVYHYGYQIGRGPLHTRSNYAIRNLLDSTQVSVVDSARWEEQAFLLIEPKTTLPDSVIYPKREFKAVHDSVINKPATAPQAEQQLRTTGAAPRINSNWNMSITKAKQRALRNLAEDLAVRVSTETYAKNNTQRRYYNFSTVYAFQRIKTMNRSFDADSFRVELAIDPSEIKMLIEE